MKFSDQKYFACRDPEIIGGLVGFWYTFKGAEGDVSKLETFRRALRCYEFPGRSLHWSVLSLIAQMPSCPMLPKLLPASLGREPGLHTIKSWKLLRVHQVEHAGCEGMTQCDGGEDDDSGGVVHSVEHAGCGVCEGMTQCDGGEGDDSDGVCAFRRQRRGRIQILS